MRNSGSFATLGIKFTSSDLSWLFQSSLPLRINRLSCPCAAQDVVGVGWADREGTLSPHVMPFHVRTAHYQNNNITNHIIFNFQPHPQIQPTTHNGEKASNAALQLHLVI
jgi:hypothetical protein